jgi:hypothetical protein
MPLTRRPSWAEVEQTCLSVFNNGRNTPRRRWGLVSHGQECLCPIWAGYDASIVVEIAKSRGKCWTPIFRSGRNMEVLVFSDLDHWH